jgi:P22 coat protein - gene protein 5
MPLLTPSAVTREALAVFHQKATFIGSMNRAYDDSFAKTGAKIGDTLKIRLPNRYKSFTGLDQTANFQNTDETSVSLQVANVRSVPLKFTDIELTLSLQDFSKRILEPAMAQLAADVENEVFQGLYWKVYQQVGTPGTIPNTLRVLNQARAKMTDSLAPAADRTTILNTDAQVEIVDAVKGLFHDQSRVAKQYREGIMGTTAGFGDIYESTLVPVHTNGTATGAHTVTAPPVEASSAINITGTGVQTIARGTVFTIANVFMVHPETKVSTGKLQQFTVLALATAVAGAYTAVQVSPAFIASTTNPRQNINQRRGLRAEPSLPQGRLHLRHGQSVHAEGCGFLRGGNLRRYHASRMEGLGYQDGHSVHPLRHPLRLRGDQARRRLPYHGLTTRRGVTAPPFSEGPRHDRFHHNERAHSR